MNYYYEIIKLKLQYEMLTVKKSDINLGLLILCHRLSHALQTNGCLAPAVLHLVKHALAILKGTYCV